MLASLKLSRVLRESDGWLLHMRIYVNGKLRETAETIFASYIVQHAEECPVIISQVNVDLPEGFDWPDTLEELLRTEGSYRG